MNSVIRLLHFANYLHIVSIPNFKCTHHFNIHSDISFLMLDYGKSLSNAKNADIIHDLHMTANVIRLSSDDIEWKNEIHFDMQISRIRYLLAKCLNDSIFVYLSNLNLFSHYCISYCYKRLINIILYLNNKIISTAKKFFSNRIIFNNYHD